MTQSLLITADDSETGATHVVDVDWSKIIRKLWAKLFPEQPEVLLVLDHLWQMDQAIACA